MRGLCSESSDAGVARFHTDRWRRTTTTRAPCVDEPAATETCNISSIWGVGHGPDWIWARARLPFQAPGPSRSLALQGTSPPQDAYLRSASCQQNADRPPPGPLRRIAGRRSALPPVSNPPHRRSYVIPIMTRTRRSNQADGPIALYAASFTKSQSAPTRTLISGNTCD
jgi:hypothetical protein